MYVYNDAPYETNDIYYSTIGYVYKRKILHFVASLLTVEIHGAT